MDIKTYSQIFTEALFITVKNEKQRRYPLTGKWSNKLGIIAPWYGCITTCFSIGENSIKHTQCIIPYNFM